MHGSGYEGILIKKLLLETFSDLVYLTFSGPESLKNFWNYLSKSL